MLKISNMVKKSGLSRSTLLYYDAIGLLSPSSRSLKGYRLYSQKDTEKMEQILSLRKMGLSLEEIKMILNGNTDSLTGLLKKRLKEIRHDILQLKKQNKIIMTFLKDELTFEQLDGMTKKQFLEVLKATGMTSDEMDKFHREFETKAPGLHREFLEFLGISPKEIKDTIAFSQSQVE